MNLIIILVTIIEFLIGGYLVYNKIKKIPDDFASNFLKIMFAMLIIPIIVFYIDYFNLGNWFGVQKLISKESWLSFFGTYVSAIFGAVLSAYVMIQMTNKQITVQRIEGCKPRLKLENITVLNESDNMYPLYGLVCENLKGQELLSTTYHNCLLRIRLQNIGIGLAQDISFYSLNTGEPCIRSLMSNPNEGQIMFSTEEIPKEESLDFYFDLCYKLNTNGKTIIEREDYSVIICKYKDINGNEYELIFGIIVKNEVGIPTDPHVIIDYYYYQPSTANYNNMVRKYRKNYNFINKRGGDNMFKYKLEDLLNAIKEGNYSSYEEIIDVFDAREDVEYLKKNHLIKKVSHEAYVRLTDEGLELIKKKDK